MAAEPDDGDEANEEDEHDWPLAVYIDSHPLERNEQQEQSQDQW
jgi:hypothetical protein